MTGSTRRTVVVTGVSSGIGRAICKFLVQQKMTVFGSVRVAKDGDELVEELGSDFHPLTFDVCDQAAIAQSRDRVSDHLNGQTLTGLINNAGLAQFGPQEFVDDREFEHVVSVNLFGTRNVTNAFLPLLRRNAPDLRGATTSHSPPGKIINISSLSGILNTPMNGTYCISKHALESMGEIYRRELIADGIDVVSIRSGPIQSEIWNKNLKPAPDYNIESYNEMSRTARTIMRDAQATALPAEVIAKLVWEIIEGRRRRTAYAVGQGALMSRLLSSDLMPTRLADWLIDRRLRPTRSH